jgi:peptidyl-prolyl cis-trans isomerase C
MLRLLIPLLLVALWTCVPAAAADLPPDVLVKSRWMELTRADYERALARVPEKMRFEFSTRPRRVQGVLNNLLVTKTLAAQARAHGTRPGTVFDKTRTDDSDRALAAAELKRIETDAGKSFDDKKATFELKAREIYALDKAKYTSAEEVRMSDIAVSIKDRGEEAALARAREARRRIVGGADFAAVAREYSDDPTTRDKGGALPFVSAKALAPEYAKAVFALTKVGEVSEPIKAPSAYHVVRLEERKGVRQQAFDDVRDTIMRDLRQRYITEQRDLRIQSIHSDPDLQINQAAIDSLVNRVDPGLMKPPVRAKTPAPASK